MSLDFLIPRGVCDSRNDSVCLGGSLVIWKKHKFEGGVEEAPI